MLDDLKILRVAVLVNLILGLGVVVVGVIRFHDEDDAQDAIVASQVAQCQQGVPSKVAFLDFGYYVYEADFASARFSGLRTSQGRIRQAEALNLLHEDEVYARHVDVSALRLTGRSRLLGQDVRDAVERSGYECGRHYG